MGYGFQVENQSLDFGWINLKLETRNSFFGKPSVL